MATCSNVVRPMLQWLTGAASCRRERYPAPCRCSLVWRRRRAWPRRLPFNGRTTKATNSPQLLVKDALPNASTMTIASALSSPSGTGRPIQCRPPCRPCQTYCLAESRDLNASSTSTLAARDKLPASATCVRARASQSMHKIARSRLWGASAESRCSSQPQVVVLHRSAIATANFCLGSTSAMALVRVAIPLVDRHQAEAAYHPNPV